MKKDRNCNGGAVPYPIYPTYMPGEVIPIMGAPGMIQSPNMIQNPSMMQPSVISNYQQNSGSIEQQISNLNSQIGSLERRVSNLENLIGNNSNQYNTSNYQVM